MRGLVVDDGGRVSGVTLARGTDRDRRLRKWIYMAFLSQLDEIDGRSLSLLQRLLLVNDGTLTDALEAAFLEPIALIKVSTEILSGSEAPAALDCGAEMPAMRMQILLRGAASRRNFVFAESWIALDRLPAGMRAELTESDTPIGRLWNEHKLETRKELLRFWRSTASRHASAGDLASFFGMRSDAGFLARSYRVFLEKAPLMIITEYFPSDLDL